MIILTVNAGSSSIRLDVFIERENGVDKLGGRKYNIKEVSLISHRIVHGGMKFITTCLINPSVEKEIDHLSSLAPLHNPFALKWVKTCREVFGENVPQVSVFDTAFYAGLPETAKTYALPKDLCEKNGIRR